MREFNQLKSLVMDIDTLDEDNLSDVKYIATKFLKRCDEVDYIKSKIGELLADRNNAQTQLDHAQGRLNSILGKARNKMKYIVKVGIGKKPRTIADTYIRDIASIVKEFLEVDSVLVIPSPENTDINIFTVDDDGNISSSTLPRSCGACECDVSFAEPTVHVYLIKVGLDSKPDDMTDSEYIDKTRDDFMKTVDVFQVVKSIAVGIRNSVDISIERLNV